MKLLLVDNLVMPEEGSLAYLDVHPHLGLLALAAVAEADGHRVQIYDPKRLIRDGTLAYDATLYERASQAILAARPDGVGFTALGCSFLFALNVAALLKRREPDLPVLLGGPHATMLHRQILERFPQFDIIVRYEADEILPAVLDCLPHRTFDVIPGLSWRATGRGSPLRFTDGKPKVEDLDLLPIASYDHYPVEELGLSMLRIEAGRGCPFACTFCSTAGFFQRSFRLKSAERLVRELDILHQRYRVSDFKLDHDMFTVNRRKVMEFCEAVAGRGYRWRASARIDCVDEPLLKKMADAGCVNLYFGVETGSERMQKLCKKRLDLQRVEPILAAADSFGIETTASFITGYPEETGEDQDDTLDMIGRCARRASCLTQLHMLAPEPGTPLFDERGAEIAYDGYGGPYNTRLLSSSDERAVLGHPDIFQTYYHYPAALPRARYIFAVEAADLLRRVGPVIFAYALRGVGGRLSTLISAWRQFADETSPGAPADAAGLEAFIAARFGRGHHLHSLFRYALRLYAARAPADVIVEGPYEPDRPCMLAENVGLLEDIHNCDALVDRIRRSTEGAPMLGDADVGGLGTYIVQGHGEAATGYWVESGIATLLDLFRSPRSCRAVAQWLADATRNDGIDASIFEPLLRRGILVSAG
ncbi:B12-binding domain-containing radical SAM protein [Burkholderia thailandensis]|uniref:B12 binding domain protein n=1 Tax=Burkholderia thailandensis TaxID=57975 RepID=A0AAW9CT52_BURTH|nr:radical SAM protein [Burkholderia thailandensis]MCS3394547.1 B12-binding domain-containing radical SAM protein [Burkholderia thailandensis]MCS6427697.1 B12-binding domain-containing radical SAM protein [Burkholderia thailandensis]MCS6455859.1 B12-binding domain-containing radical SAM protein [Burkholderia thailandensis]MCS6466862.1 B12-binding domain-containing radical SAM protein [Burkholderia thailandensis]MCS6485490.1 B12-binding domain-containing radical SAM protein [Burkholderia thaila